MPRTMNRLAVSNYYSEMGDIVTSVSDVLADPALPETVALIGRLRAVTAGGAPSPEPGIGLNKINSVLSLYVEARENPILGILGLAAIIGIPVAIGYSLGKR